MTPRRLLLCLCLTTLALGGCHSSSEKSQSRITLADSVTFERDVDAGVQIIAVDTRTATVRPVVVAENIEQRRNNVIGDSKTVREWAEKYGALAGINAGYFGDTYDQVGRRKQLVGLATLDNKVVAPWGVLSSSGSKPERYIRSAVGFGDAGVPSIVWATGSRRGGMKQYEGPLNPLEAEDWHPHFAVGCGPHLWADGVERVTDREERLVSAGKRARVFVAYDLDEHGPRHLLLCRADAMEYRDASRWLGTYFKKRYSTDPQEAMCLDGGSSAQLVYRGDGQLQDAEPTGVLVPTAILLLPRTP